MKVDYAISTFCYGDRYYKQTNRLIESFDFLEIKPEIFIVTDSPDSILKKDNVHVKNVKFYDESYLNYEKDNYYSFDFSVKRFSLSFAFENGYEKVILTDTDAVANPSIYNHDVIKNTFIENSISGQVTYSFKDQIITNSMLGRRFLHYEKTFNKEFDKELLNEMVEDCIQFISINNGNNINFINTWSELIKIKRDHDLHNTPAGNIDEMCFAGLMNDVYNKNSSSKSVNALLAIHDKWY
jgi:hypothetical protein